MPSCIVFAEVACSDGSIVATVCENGCIYFMDSRGITLVCVGEPRQLQQLHASAMLPPLPGGSSHLVATIIFGSGDGVSIAHARGVPVTDFTPWAGLKYVEGLQGFCAVALLGELPLALIFCKAAVYLWDVHHNCVVATLTGLPPIVPYTLQEETVVVRKSLSQASSKQQELFTLLCTGTAVLWQTHNGSYAYLPFTTLLSSVYPLLLQRFPSAPLQTLAWVLQKVPPHHRHVPDRITAVALLSSSQTQEISTISTGTCGMSCSQPFSFSTCKSPARVTERTVEPLYHDVAMARFFESICNSENVLNNELMRLFHSA
ncbi:hypothetical protein ERJ75_001243100 [Trypanosoma vivax]|nr:hypothetical protein ERJ75_001243100 [Trypanosoma vivax]